MFNGFSNFEPGGSWGPQSSTYVVIHLTNDRWCMSIIHAIYPICLNDSQDVSQPTSNISLQRMFFFISYLFRFRGFPSHSRLQPANKSLVRCLIILIQGLNPVNTKSSPRARLRAKITAGTGLWTNADLQRRNDQYLQRLIGLII